MRSRLIGTGPFKFVEFKPNESIKVARNPDYWKPGLPYLDGIEYTVIRNTSTAVLTLAAGKLDRTWPGIVPIALMREIKGQGPQIECEINAWNNPRLLSSTVTSRLSTIRNCGVRLLSASTARRSSTF